ncbi:transposase domain-containing protein [Spirochaeta cellobiosiphila]|uniref:transposase domain-containing protein n=1 Tax=Spirochaeta cellobiosiphila TaxID=504483 RepID=UPI0004116104
MGDYKGNNTEASCFYYSLIETTKQNGLNPHLYLAYIFKQAPLITNKTEWEYLLP